MSVRADNILYILVNESGQPVPLPFYTLDDIGQPVTIHNFSPNGKVLVSWNDSTDKGWYEWEGLKIITEAEYMEKQS